MPSVSGDSSVEVSEGVHWGVSREAFQACNHEAGSYLNCWHREETFQCLKEKYWGTKYTTKTATQTVLLVPSGGTVVFGKLRK